MKTKLPIMLVVVLVLALGVFGIAYAITNGQPDGNNHPYVGLLIFDVAPGTTGCEAGGPCWRCSGALIAPDDLDYDTSFKPASQDALYEPNAYRSSDHDAVVVGLELVNYPPELGAITVSPNVVVIGASVNASVPFTDPDALDTHTAVWDWGDGSTSAGTVTENLGAGSITGNHSYSTPGVYTVQVTVQDNYGNADSALYEYVVVYDPNGGFVTGGGWIDSPEGAYAADPTLTGKANFGFVSKYQRSAAVPNGQTQFQFQVAGLRFSSQSYQWLVVAGQKAMFKGNGKVNGTGGYGFLLSAVDGGTKGVDKFRIKIWNKETGAVIYDNQVGAADNADPTTAIGGGSIIIHK